MELRTILGSNIALAQTTLLQMASFLIDLFQSIFTPGPTPILLVATNTTFACLQVVLLLLLIATYSTHFLILSCLSAGLWSAINWFVSELKVAQALEEEKKRYDNEARGKDTEMKVATAVSTEDSASGSSNIELSEKQAQPKARGSCGAITKDD